MKQVRQTVEVSEAIGIVISDGARPPVTPRLAAYVWGPVPTDADGEGKAEAA